MNYTGWWFQTVFIFHNIWDNPSHWLSYFSRWLKPPASIYIYNICILWCMLGRPFCTIWRLKIPIPSAGLSIPPVRSLGVGCSLRAAWRNPVWCLKRAAMCFTWKGELVWNSSWYSTCLDWFYRNQSSIAGSGSLFDASFESCWFICKRMLQHLSIWCWVMLGD